MKSGAALALCFVLAACSRSAQPSDRGTSTESRSSGTSATPIAPPAVNAPAAVSPSPVQTGAPSVEGSGGGDNAQPRSGTSNPFDEHGGAAASAGSAGECQRDDDCACGIDRSTGACAFGAAARIDTARQCPDFCGGISGAMRVSCDHGRCVQR